MQDRRSDAEAGQKRPPAPEAEPSVPPHAELGVLALVVALFGVVAVAYLKGMAPLLGWEADAGATSTAVAFAAEVTGICAAYAGWVLLVGALVGIAGLFQRGRRRVLAAIAVIPGIPVMIMSGAALASRPFYIVVFWVAAAAVPLAIAVRLLNARAARQSDAARQGET